MNNSLVLLFEHELQDIYSAENQLRKALPHIIKKVSSTDLKDALGQHLQQTKDQINRLEEIQNSLGVSLEGRTCLGMKGLLDEAEEIMKDKKFNGAIDAAIVGATQKMEHYEISSYNSAISHAETIEYEGVIDRLRQSLSEEYESDLILADIAKTDSNIKALKHFIKQ